MPIYEYECAKCGNRFEKLIRNMAADIPDKCPKCGAAKPKKVFSAFSVAAAAPSASSESCSSCASEGSCPYSGGGCDDI